MLVLPKFRDGDDGLKFNNHFNLEHWRGGKKLQVVKSKNLVVNVGLNALLDIMFHAATQVTTWYLGLIDNSGYSAVAAGDTMSSHSGWTEFDAYSEGVRQAWVEAAASGQSITSSAVATFTINADGEVRGSFLTSNSTLNGTTGTLWAATLFGSVIEVVNADELKVTYTVNASG